MKNRTEIELKFLVPQSARTAIVAELERGSTTLNRTPLLAMHLDTDDRRLARAGMSWRLRREGRRWIRTLKSVDSNALERSEHEAIRPDASPDPSEHAGTAPGDRLIGLLRRARLNGIEPGGRFRTEVRRTARRIRTRGALVEVAFDEGRLVSAHSSQRIRELEFELVSGSPLALLALAERWRKRFGLVYDPRSKAERGNGGSRGRCDERAASRSRRCRIGRSNVGERCVRPRGRRTDWRPGASGRTRSASLPPRCFAAPAPMARSHRRRLEVLRRPG